MPDDARPDREQGYVEKMAIGRAARRESRRARAVAVFGEQHASAVLDLVELVELAWHDCYGEVAPPDGIIDDMFLLSEGSVERLIAAAHLGVTDPRDLAVAAGDLRRDS